MSCQISAWDVLLFILNSIFALWILFFRSKKILEDNEFQHLKDIEKILQVGYFCCCLYTSQLSYCCCLYTSQLSYCYCWTLCFNLFDWLDVTPVKLFDSLQWVRSISVDWFQIIATKKEQKILPANYVPPRLCHHHQVFTDWHIVIHILFMISEWPSVLSTGQCWGGEKENVNCLHRWSRTQGSASTTHSLWAFSENHQMRSIEPVVYCFNVQTNLFITQQFYSKISAKDAP